jgi:hypothetical protein
MKQALIAAVAVVAIFHGSRATAASDAYNQYLANTEIKAEAGDAKAETALGTAYSLGNGVPKDDVEAVQWFRKAAEQGDANGETFLGAAYSNGKGIPIDKAEAATWWRKAAEQGNPDGEDFLGQAYYVGIGVPRDNALAMKLLRRAAEQGNSGAISFLKIIGVPVKVQVGE